MTLTGLILFLLIGALAGWIAGLITKGSGFGVVGNMLVGFVGAFLGGFCFRLLGIAAFGFLGQIAHISSDLYSRVRKLEGLVKNPELATFAQSEWRFTERDFMRYREMTLAVSKVLHDRCVLGALVQDLDVQAQIASTPSCSSRSDDVSRSMDRPAPSAQL